ncbi:hypothetical protein B9Z55_000225 [Caenorhabditis nigoni]|uniref:Uncharacterized protein n=1 Tax=Caenorhabditis nigoni TaxID=1611254 RepID=A0A2G5VJU7_9PELO|nr:hypothetical protein B9Z55_000225 [Caenorhabditis nigoni]
MAREGTRYMVRNGYILLEDLESWYESGFVTPDDTVRIFNANGDSKEFKISSLIFLYGSEHPFQKAAKLLDSDYSSSDSDEERAGPSTVPPTVPPPKKVGGAFGAKRNATPTTRSESEKEQKSVPQKVGGAFGVRKVLTPPTSAVPLKTKESEKKPEEDLGKVGGASEKDYTGDNEPGGNNPRVALMDPPLTTDGLEMIGKDKLQDFYRDLKPRLTVVGKQTANSKLAGWKCGYCSSEKNTVVCNTQLDAFNHVSKNKHKKNMQFTVPESDLTFWNNWIDEMNLGAPEDSIRYNDYPLFNADNEPEEDRITGQKVIDEMNKLKSLFPRLNWTGKPDKWFDSVYPVKEPICRLCNFAPFSTQLFYVHLFYDAHIAQLAKCQISKKSFEFWEQKFLKMRKLEDDEMKVELETKKLSNKNESAKFGNFSEGLNMVDRKWDNPGIPLLDPPIKPVAKLKQDQFIRYYKSLSKAMTNPAARQIAQIKKVNWRCGYCSTQRSTVSFCTELAAFDHILGQKHKEKATKEEEEQKKAPEDPTSSGNYQNPMTSSSSTSSATTLSSIIRNNPRVALMDPPLTNDRFQMCRQDKFVHFCNELSASLTEIGVKTATSRHANWKCGYCSSETDTVVCNTQFDAFNHVLKQKHKEKMKFTAPELDFKFWCDWVDEMNSGAPETMPTVVQNLPELQKSESQASQKSAAKVPENSNEPRVPLLAPMPKNENMVSKKEFNEILDECAKMFQTHKQRLSAAKKIPAFVACTYCSKPGKPLVPSNVQDQLLHIVKLAHREKMQYKACLSDLQYWKSWVENYGIPKNVLESRKSPEKSQATVPPKRKLRTSGQTDKHNYFSVKNGLENNEPFKKGCNNPRVPLLDFATNQGKLMKQIQYKEHYTRICEMLKERKSCAETEKSIKCICFHCPGDTRITTVMELLKHVFNGKHAENIRFIANKEDFTYYEDIIRKMPRIQAPLAAVSRTPVSVVSPIQKPATVSSNTVPQEAKTAVKPAAYVVKPEPQFVAQGEQRILQPNEPIMDPISAPIPTDPVHRTVSAVPQPTQAPRRLCSLPLFVSRRPKLEGTRPTEMQLSFINGLTSEGVVRGLPYVADGTYCGFCDEDMTGWDVGRIALHAFSDSHLRTLRNFVYISDFQHWIDMLERRGLSPSHLAAYVVRPDPPQPETQQQIPEMVPIRCELPLYVSYPKRSDAGPLISQVSFINSIGGFEATRPYVPDGTYCGFCNVDMQKWNLMSLARHAFSVRHLRKLGNLPHSSDFQYWIDLIKCLEFAISLKPEPFLPLETFLGLNSMMAPNQYDDFSNFSPRQMELISNVDMEKVEKCAELLNEFGGCISCEKWLLTGQDVFEHWTKEIKQHLFVSRARMDVLMAYVEKCQKEASLTTQASKPAPVSSQTIEQASIGQRTPHAARVVRQDSPIVPQRGVPQQIIQVVRTRCTLPLYISYPTMDPIGPLNCQVSFINRVSTIRGIEATSPHVADGTYCGSCNVDMTGCTLIRVVRHAFSVNHLRKLDTLPPSSSFQHWIDMIKCRDLVLTSQCTPSPLQTLLGLKSMKALYDFDVFSNFSPRQMELISTVDMEKIEKCGQLLNEFGGCVYCEKWLLTGREVFEHWVPQQHFLKIRQQHPVSQNRMDIFMACVEKCQKEKSGPISLEDLEALYANGSVTPDDTIQITQRGATVTYEISFLIYLYGETHPFRRIPRPEVSKNVGGAFGELGNFTEISIPFEKIPLLSSYHGINKKKLEVEDIQILKNLFEKVCKARELLAEDLFFHRVFDFCLQRQVKDCKVCNHAISPKHLLKIIQHIFSEEHLSKLKGISNREINFWINIFHLGSMIRKRSIENWQQILTLKNLSTRIPLIDFDIQSELVPADLRESKISTLHQIFNSLDSKIWSTTIPPISKLPDTVVCVACSKLPNIFKLSNVEITAHLFSESHLFFLIQFGFTQKDYDWWEQFFKDVAEATVIQEEGNLDFLPDSTTENNQIHVEEVPESSETTTMHVESIEPPATLSESLAPTAMPKVITASGTSEWLFQDYPLFHPNNQPDNDLITGQEVIDEIEKLKKMINLDPMPEEYKEYFFFVNGRFPKMGLRNRAVG